MDQPQTDVGPQVTENQAIKLRQGVMLGRMRYVLGISLTLTIIMFVIVYLVIRH
jgi:hypothetical protein